MKEKRSMCRKLRIARLVIGETGQSAVLFGLMIAGLLGMVAIAVDGGNLYGLKRDAQSAADLAALAGAQHLYDGSISDAVSDAQAYAARNGYADAVVNVPPTTGPHQGQQQYVEVIINRSTPTFFAGIFGVGQVAVSARATAHAGHNTPPYAVLALSRTSQPAISFSGSNNARILNSGIMSNSSMNPSLNQQATSGSVYAEGPVNAVGTILGNFDAPSVSSGVPPYPDPLADMPPPTFMPSSGSDCPTCDAKIARHGTPSHPSALVMPSSGGVLPTRVYDCQGDQHTFCPGVYWGGIQIAGGTYTMMPGIYVMAGGGLAMTGGRLTGYGILIYNTNDPARPNGAGDYAPINFNTNQGANLSASHSPQYYSNGRGWGVNVLIFQDRNAGTSQDDMGLQAVGNTQLFGTIYLPSNGISVAGGGAAGVANGQIIASTIAFGGGSATTMNYYPLWAVIPPGSSLAE